MLKQSKIDLINSTSIYSWAVFRTDLGLVNLGALVDKKSSKLHYINELNFITSKEKETTIKNQNISWALGISKKLNEYFNGDAKALSNIPYKIEGVSEFVVKVLQMISCIPYGETRSYSDLAKLIKNPLSRRAVATACGKNPLLLIIPCHRVIRSDGTLGGFSAGIDLKKKLLRLEEKYIN